MIRQYPEVYRLNKNQAEQALQLANANFNSLTDVAKEETIKRIAALNDRIGSLNSTNSLVRKY